ncbi:c-Maf-inducing protein [Trichonephila clavipes]|nr:c-Maf-inducing protein [Trichonephila clavipes]
MSAMIRYLDHWATATLGNRVKPFSNTYEDEKAQLKTFLKYSVIQEEQQPGGFMEEPIPYRIIQDIYPVARWDSCGRFCIRVVIPDGSLLFQVSNCYMRDQWLHSLLWKKNVYRNRKLLDCCTRPEILLKELKAKADKSLGSLQVPRDRVHSGQSFPWLSKTLCFLGHGSTFVNVCGDNALCSPEGQRGLPVESTRLPSWLFGRLFHCRGSQHDLGPTNLVDMVLLTPLQDESVYHSALNIISDVVVKGQTWMTRSVAEEVIVTISLLLERTTPTSEICDFFCWHCRESPRSTVVLDICTPIVQRILKHNMDFGKYPQTRVFVQEYFLALNCQNRGDTIIKEFVYNKAICTPGHDKMCPIFSVDQEPVRRSFTWFFVSSLESKSKSLCGRSMHGLGCQCPHPRVLQNLVNICVAAIYTIYESKKTSELLESDDNEERTIEETNGYIEWKTKLDCFINIFILIFLELIGNKREFIFPKKTPKKISGKVPYRFVTQSRTCDRCVTGFSPGAAKDLPCRGDQCTLNLSWLEVLLLVW